MAQLDVPLKRLRVGQTARREHSYTAILHKVHRYFLPIALVFIFIRAWDAYEAVWWPDDSGTRHFGIGVGTVVLTVNVVLLSCYTFGCHSLRHLVGGARDR